MVTLLIILISILAVIAVAVLFIVYKANKFKNKIEDAVVDGVKEVIVENTPKVIKAIGDKIQNKYGN